jgi:hypothetical protein
MRVCPRHGAAATIALLGSLGLLATAHAQKAPPEKQKPAAQQPAPAAKKNPLLKLIEPWPSPEKMRERRLEAEASALFAAVDPIEVTLVADFKVVNRDRDPESKQRFPGTLKLGDTAIDVQLSARGHVRRMSRTCDYVPLRVVFPKKGAAGTPFAREDALKLVVQCSGGGDYEQYILREYLAYKIFNVITPSRSFRARLARVTYVDRASGKTAGTRAGMFLEDDGEVARRMEGRVVELPRLMFDDVDMDTLMPMMIFEYMIGNTDYSIYALHNVRIVQRPDKSLHPVPYDFDFSGLVNPPYAVPARNLMLKSVVERMYRGPCRRQEQVDPIVANFVAKKDTIRALPDSIPGMDKASREEARRYIDSFYASIRSTKDVRGLFVSCTPKPTM